MGKPCLGEKGSKRRSRWFSWHTAGGFSGSSPSVPPARTGSTSRVCEQSWFTAVNSGSCSQQHLSRAFRCLRTLGTKPPGLGSVKKNKTQVPAEVQGWVDAQSSNIARQYFFGPPDGLAWDYSRSSIFLRCHTRTISFYSAFMDH